ncbi:diguanylate cyclase, partial [Arthrospira platensis SPKY1]|nr:diguanylate cyclase [Arthrospira platensis SPKY1]
METLINRLIARIAEPIDLIPGKSEEVSGSIGIVVHDSQRTVEPDQLIRQADQAMYQAKQAGKNRYHIFDADQEQAIRDHHENLERIRAALEQGEFTLYYQPKVNMR